MVLILRCVALRAESLRCWWLVVSNLM